MRTHQQLDQRSLELHQLVAAKMRNEPALLEKAKAILMRWRTTASPNSMPYLDAWKCVLEDGLEATIALAVDPSEHATAMRQSSPLSCLLQQEERLAFLRQWKQSQDNERGVVDINIV